MENNPILNSPYSEPRWHCATDLQGNHVVVATTTNANPDANFREHIAAKTLEELPDVQSYFINAYSDFQIPYVAKGKDRHYKPDFICCCRTKDSRTLMLILEITGANMQYKAEKKHYTKTYWILAVNAVAGVYPELGGMEWRLLDVGGDVRDLKGQIITALNT